MIDAYELYRDTLDQVNKEEAGYLNVQLFNRMANAQQLQLFKKLKAELEDPAAAREIKQINADLLFPFISSQINVAAGGVFARPADYEFFSALRANFDGGQRIIMLNHLYSLLCEAETDPTIFVDDIQEQIDEIINAPEWVEVQILAHDRVARRQQSYIKGKRPWRGKPIAEQIANAFQLLPKNSASVQLIYYRKPADGRVTMRIDTRTNDEVYDPLNSDPWEWTQGGKGLLVGRIAQFFSVYVREKDLFQMEEVVQNERPKQ